MVPVALLHFSLSHLESCWSLELLPVHRVRAELAHRLRYEADQVTLPCGIRMKELVCHQFDVLNLLLLSDGLYQQ